MTELRAYLETYTLSNWLFVIVFFGLSHFAAFICGYWKMSNECRRRLCDQADARTERIAKASSYLIV